MRKKFLMLEHDADIKYKITGKSLNEIFQNSAEAFSDYISSGNKIDKNTERKIEIKSDNKENLLYLFIDQLIYLLDAENFAVKSAKIKIKENKLVGKIYGDDVKRYNLNHVKAATYAEMSIKEIKKNIWQAIIVFDV